MAEPTRTEGVPHDRLTRICDAMTTAMETHPEYVEGQDKAAVFMDSDVEGVGGLVLFGYEEDTDAIGAIFQHLTMLFRANGMTLKVFPMPGPAGEG